jgi:hypothetical protein
LPAVTSSAYPTRSLEVRAPLVCGNTPVVGFVNGAVSAAPRFQTLR